MIVIPYLLLCTISFLLSSTHAVHRGYYSIKTPYREPPSTLVLPSPPVGFKLVCAQILVRHGCRALEGRKYDTLTMALWTQAKTEGALTKFGEQLGKDLEYFIAVNDALGRGELSGLGKLEQQGLAHRLTNRLLPSLTKIRLSNSSSRIQVVSSSELRTFQSLNAFLAGFPSSIASLVDYEPANPTLLAFHLNTEYRAYVKIDQQLNNTVQSIRMQPYSKQMARNVLSRVYKQSFIDRLTHGYYSYTDSETGESIANEVDAARMLNDVYLVAPGLREEGVGSLLEKYFHEDESAWFAYLKDVFYYYTAGPSFSNQTIIFDMAQILVDDFVRQTDTCSQPDASHFLQARFSHDETIIAFEALLKIPLISDKSTPANETYTYANNGWRGELLSPMTANIQWEIYRHRSHGRTRYVPYQQILVRMLLNEYPVPFKYECKPYNTIHDFFYTLDELKRCYDIADP